MKKIDQFCKNSLEFLKKIGYICFLILEYNFVGFLIRLDDDITTINRNYPNLYSVYVCKQGLSFQEWIMGLMILFTLYGIIRRKKMDLESFFFLSLMFILFCFLSVGLLMNTVEMQKQVSCHSVLLKFIIKGDDKIYENERSAIQKMLYLEQQLPITDDYLQMRMDIEKQKLKLCFGTSLDHKTLD